MFAALGVWLLTDDGGSGGTVAAGRDNETATATASATATQTRTSTPTPSATATPSPSATATATATATARQTGGGSGATNPPQQTAPEPTATPTPTAPAVVAGGDYCPPAAVSSLPTGRVAGAVTQAGGNAPPGTVEVFLAFDGVLGPSVLNGDGFFRLDFWASTETCANRVGAAISVYANGQYFPSGHTIGDGELLIPVAVTLP
ncbi:MAG: hypothetical protein IH609_20970 [Dehalococcoidia bacterium]|nr:hypothetical protein [Dehalococcoidia bacterium]